MIDALTGAFHDGFGYLAISYCLAAIGLNIQYGFAGLLNFGQAAFLAVGGYIMGAAIFTLGLPTLASMLIAIGFAVVLALILGVPTLRLRADYLAIVTIAVAEVLRLVFGTTFREYFHGKDGVSGFANGFRSLNPFSFSGTFLTFSANDLFVLLVGWTVVALSCLLVWALVRSPWGRVLKAIREDEDAVRSLGKNVYGYKMQALVLGGVLGTIGGFIGAMGAASVQADTFNLDFTFVAFTMLILGGAARVLGPVIGAILFWAALSFIGTLLGNLASNPWIADHVMNQDQASNIRFMLVGLVLMLLMIFRPQGIIGDRKEIALDAR